jgi:hypothetical protein
MMTQILCMYLDTESELQVSTQKSAEKKISDFRIVIPSYNRAGRQKEASSGRPRRRPR